MAFGRRRGNRALDQFGPGDVLIAASQRLPSSQGEIVLRYVLDDDFVRRALEDFQTWDRLDVVTLGDVCSRALEYITNAANHQVNVDERVAQFVVDDTWRACGFISGAGLRGDEFYLALAAVDGVKQLIHLRRIKQANETLGFVVVLMAFIVNGRIQGQG